MNTRNCRLRPLGITDILDETVDLYKTNFALLAGISAVIYVPYTLLSSFLPQPKMSTAAFNPSEWVGFGLLILLFSVIINPLVTGALTFAISERYLGRATTIADCYLRVAKPSVLFRFICATFLTGLITAAAFLVPILLIAVAAALMGGIRTGLAIGIGIILISAGIVSIILPIWVALRYTLVAPTYIIELHGPISALRRSWYLMKGNALKAFGLLAISGIVVTMIQGIISAPTSFLVMQSAISGSDPALWVTALHTVLNSAVSTLLMPITSIVVILLYYDIRIRKEGFDLEMLASELDQKTRKFSAYDITSLPQEQVAHPHEAAPEHPAQVDDQP